MTTANYLLPLVLFGCIVSAPCAETNREAKTSKSLYSSGTVLQRMYLKDAEEGNVVAQFELGFLYFSGADGAKQDYEKAREWLTKSAEKNHSKAQFLLGGMYQGALGTNKNITEAVRWLQKAIEMKTEGKEYNLESNQLAIAYFSLGQCFFGGIEGNDKDPDYDKCLGFFRKAAELGYPKAQIQMGIFYGLGLSVKADQSEAIKWYEKAAKQGEFQGFYMLGEFYKEGRGVPQNFVEAYKWYSLATAAGNVSANSQLTKETVLPLNALRIRDELAKQLTSEQLTEGQKRTEKFWADIKK